MWGETHGLGRAGKITERAGQRPLRSVVRNLRANIVRPYKGQRLALGCSYVVALFLGGCGGILKGESAGGGAPYFPPPAAFFWLLFLAAQKSNARPARAKPCGVIRKKARHIT